MNPKFFDVKKEKQDAIINACLKVFAENGYKKASTDVIVKTAGISKGLLFHYFESKKGAYEFIYDYSVKYMMLELTQSVKKGERDFFEIQRTIEGVKTRVMRNYPYMQQFLDSIRFEDHPDALAAIGEDKEVLRDTYNSIYRQADMSRFDDFVDINRVINMISWMSEGFIKDRFRQQEEPDLDEMNMEFSRYLIMLRDHLYRPGVRRTTFIKPLEPAEGNRMTAVANGREKEKEKEREKESHTGHTSSLSQLAKQLSKPAEKKPAKSPSELSFEERLARRDTSIFGVPVPPKEEKKETAKEKKELTEEKKEAVAEKAEPAEEKKAVPEDIRKPSKLPGEISVADKETIERTEDKNEPAAPDNEPLEALGREDNADAKKAEEASEAIKIETSDNGPAEMASKNIQESAGETEPAKEEGAREGISVISIIDEDNAAEAAEPEKAALEPFEEEEAPELSAVAKEAVLEESLSDNTDSDMIDLSALYSKRMEEAVEEFSMNIPDGYDGYGQGYEAGYDQEAAFYQGNDPSEYYGNIQPFASPISPIYPPDEYEDDSAAYAELYNSVNNYDINGATQEMPVNEVLAYRNAFTSEYMRQELEKTGSASKDEPETGENKKEKKPKKKSFFSGLFGKKNEEERDDKGQEASMEAEAPSGPVQQAGVPAAGQAQPYMPEQYNPMQQDLSSMGPAPELPEYDPNMAAQYGSYETPVYYDIKY